MILGIIQARLGSKRFPSKALREINGKPLLWYLYERAAFSKLIDKVVISTVDNVSNLPIIKFAQENNIGYFAGSEQDLADRLYNTAKKFGAEVIVRLTGDCPLADAQVIDKLLTFYQANTDKYDYVSNIVKPTYPDGLDAEVIPIRALERLWNEITDPFWREWVTSYILENQKDYKVANIENSEDLSHLRWTVDYEEDFIFVTKIFEKLYAKKRNFLMGDILNLLKEEPWIGEINNKHNRNEAYYNARKEANK